MRDVYKKYVKGKEKWWIAGGITSMYLANPEKFHDATGNATEWFSQVVADGAIKTITIVSESATKGVWNSIENNFEHIKNSPFAIAGIIGVIIILFSPLRNLFFKVLKYFVKNFIIGNSRKNNKKPKEENSEDQIYNQEKRFNDFS